MERESLNNFVQDEERRAVDGWPDRRETVCVCRLFVFQAPGSANQPASTVCGRECKDHIPDSSFQAKTIKFGDSRDSLNG